MGDLPSTWFLVHLWSGITYRLQTNSKMKQHHNSQRWQGVVFFSFLSFSVDSHSLLMVFAVCGRYVVQQLQHPPTSRLHLWHLSMESFRVRWSMEVPFKTIRWVYHGSSQIRTAPWTTDDILKFSLEFFGRKKLKKYHHAPNSTALILFNKDNIQNNVIHFPVCQLNHIQKTLLALVIHRRKSQDSNTRLTPYFSYFSNGFCCKMR